MQLKIKLLQGGIASIFYRLLVAPAAAILFDPSSLSRTGSYRHVADSSIVIGPRVFAMESVVTTFPT